jgi:P pilus assembly chaperone PapD
MMLRFLAIFALTAVIVLPLAEAEAVSIRVTPTKVELSTDGRAASVRIKNESDQPTTVQALAMPWISAEDRSKPVQEILVVPPIVDLQAGSEQTIRLVARGMEAETNEKAYVLRFNEVPNSAQIEGSGLAFVLNVELPLFVTPRAAKPEPVWTLEKTADGQPSLSLMNLGSAHLRVGSFALAELSSGDYVFEERKAAYALPGEKNIWPLDVGIEALSKPLALKAETNIGLIEQVISLPES